MEHMYFDYQENQPGWSCSNATSWIPYEPYTGAYPFHSGSAPFHGGDVGSPSSVPDDVIAPNVFGDDVTSPTDVGDDDDCDFCTFA